MTDRVNSGTSTKIRVRFKDALGADVVPTAVKVGIRCLATNTYVRQVADFSGTLGATITVPVTADENTLLRPSEYQVERKRLIVNATLTGGDKVTGFHEYLVISLDRQ